MSEFNYIAYDRDGAAVRGRLTAPTVDAAHEELDRRNLIPVSLKPWRSFGSLLRLQLGSPHWPIQEKILFTRKLGSLLQAGIPLLKVFELIAAQTRNPPIAAALRHIADMVAQGKTLSNAMEQYPKLFDPVFLGALRTGEATGHMDTVLEQTADFLEREMVMQRQLKKTVRYPMLVVIALILAGTIVVGFVVPKFMAFYTAFGSELPAPTRLLLAISGLVQRFWWIIPPLGGIGWFWWWHWTRTASGRRKRDRWILNLPLFGIIFLKAAVSRFTRLFAILFSAGIPAATALNTVAEAIGNAVVADEVISMRERLATGEAVSDIPENAVMPDLVYQMLGIGFESGDVERMLKEVSRHYDQEIEYDVRRLTDKIEPLLLLVMAAGVLTLALAVLMPMWNLISIFQK